MKLGCTRLARDIGIVLTAATLAACSGDSRANELSTAGPQSRVLENERPFALRLSGSHGWRQCATGSGNPRSRALRCSNYSSRDLLLRLSQETTPDTHTATAGWSDALLTLVTDANGRRTERVFDALEHVVASQPRMAAAHSDLGVAHLVRFEALGDVTDLFIALDEVEHAAMLAPSSEVILFNRAQMLDRVHLYDQALAAWDAYLRVSPAGAWKDEATAHRDMLAHESRGAGPRNWTDTAIVAKDPLGAREFVLDSLLPQWAEPTATLAAREAALRTMSVVASVLAQRGDSSTAHVVAACERATPEVRRTVSALATATRLFRRGKNHEAYPDLTRASRALRRSGAASLADWGDIAVASIDVYSAQYRQAEARLGAIESDARRRSDIALMGRAEWMLALSQALRGATSEALASYAAAAQSFGRIGERANEVAMLSQRADVLFDLGRDREALEGHAAALAQVRVTRAPARRVVTLLDVASECEELGLPYAGAALLREGVSTSKTTGREIDESMALSRLAEAVLKIGRIDEGRSLLRATRRSLEHVSDPSARRRIEMEIDASEATLLARDSTRASIASLDRVLAYYRTQGIAFDVASVLIRRGRLRLSITDTLGAEGDLQDAVSTVESQAPKHPDAATLRTIVAVRRDAYNGLVAIRAARGDTLGALLLAQRGRGNQLKTLLPAARGELTITYALLPGELLAWAATDGRVRMSRSVVSADTVTRDVDLLESALRHGDTAEADSVARKFHQLLVAPFANELARAEELVVEADGSLARVPFALLPDEKGKRLVEGTSISYSASSRPREAVIAHGAIPTLIESPSFDRALFPSLETLPGAAREADSVRVVYPHLRVVSPAGATKPNVVRALTSSSIVHFAGHAERIERQPLLSHLVLSAAPGGFDANVLSAGEIASLDLRRLALMILSSCGTTQRYSRRDAAEGGLASAFIDAGAGAVVSSLWDADDEQTAALMTRFHRHLAGGMTPARALRAAQVESLSARGAPDRLRTWSLFRLDRA